MADIKQYEPLWGAWYVESPIGKGSFGRVYKIRKEEFGKTYWSAVKILSVPQNEDDLRQARSEGLDDASVRSRFHAIVMEIVQEADLMYALRGNSNIVSFEEHKVMELEGEIGWDILIRMELLESLSERVTEKPLSEDEVVKLGIHICRALELCALKNAIHRDIKPDNIFVSQYGEYKLGDFGIARQIERTLSGFTSKQGTYTYMAPEVYKGEEYGASVDTYSLGIVMYRYLNQNRPPFQPDFPGQVAAGEREKALLRRIRGEALPPINGVGPALLDVVLKACAYKREDRFASAAEMREALENIAGVKNYAPSVTETPPARQKVHAGSAVYEPSATAGIFQSRVAPHVEEEKTAAPREKPVVSPETLKALSLFGGVCFAVLGLLGLAGGMGVGVYVFLPLYCLCAAQCFMKFGSRRFNALFLSALPLYLAYSFLFEFSIFDYHTLILTWSLLALYAANAPGGRLRMAFCVILPACSVVTWFLMNRALNGIPAGVYHDYVAGGAAVPFLMLFISAAAILLCAGAGKPSPVFCAAAALAVVQCFPLAALAARAMGGSISYVAEAGFTRIALARFNLGSGWRFCAALIQCLAFTSAFILAFLKFSLYRLYRLNQRND